MNVGPSPARARRPRPSSPRTRRGRRRRRRGRPASRSRPPCRRGSARPSASRAASRSPTGCCCRRGSTGAFITPANVAPSWNAPSDVAPSPKSASATLSSPFELRAPREPDGVRHLRRDRHADRRDVVLHRVPPARRDGRATRTARSRPACRAGGRSPTRGSREDPVALLEREDGTGLHRLVVPEDRVRPDPALPVVDDRALVVRPQEDEVAVELEELVAGRARRPRRPAAPSPSPMTRRRSPSAGSTRLIARHCRGEACLALDEDRHRIALGLVDGLEDVARVLAVHLER